MYFKNGKPSAYVRRYVEDIRGTNISTLLNPHLKLIKKLSGNKYNDIDYKTNAFWAVYRDQTGKVKERSAVPILYTAALSNWERSKGADRGEINYFIFDEFLTRTRYLVDEFEKFSNCHSSFTRNRVGVITYMIANTVNNESIYWDEMGLTKIRNIKPGDIQLYNYNNEKLTVAVERTLHATAKANVEYYYAFDNPRLDMIKTGEWEQDSYAHLEKGWSITKENTKAVFFVLFNDTLIRGNIIYDYREKSLFLYFHRNGNGRMYNDHDVVFMNRPTTSVYHFHEFSDTPISNKFDKLFYYIKWCLSNDKVYYSSNSVGEVIRNFILNPYDSGGKS